MGLNASYMNRFLHEIESEVPEYIEYPIEIKLNNEERWNGQIMTFRKQEEKNFKKEIIELEYNSQIAKRVTIDLRNKVSIAAGGFNSQVAEDTEPYFDDFLKQFINFIDINSLELEANRYKLIKGYSNLIINKSAIQKLITDSNFNLYSHKEQFGLNEAISGKIHSVAVSLIKDYINKYYTDKEKEFLSKYLTYDLLDYETHAEMFPASQKMIVKEKNDLFEGKELFVLRNLSIKGIGFFMESSSFYPDFILWVVDKNKQHIYFLDPKGILLGDNHFNNPKILWCKESAPELGQKIQQELTKDKKEISVSVSAFILSNTSFNEVRDRWGAGIGTTKEDFEKNHVLFIENNKDYLIKIFNKLE